MKSTRESLILLQLAVSFIAAALPLKGVAAVSPLTSNNRNVIAAPNIANIRTLSQNWDDKAARDFYNTPQGSHLLPYKWFLCLEQHDSGVLFREAQNIRSLGYIPRSSDGNGNSDGLPIGFVRDTAYLGLTCAACHTAQINYKDSTWLIDGGPTLADGEMFLSKLELALKRTLANDDKFSRFANGVLGPNHNDGSRTKLKHELKAFTEKRSQYNDRNLSKPAGPKFGPGRIDAFGAIMNEIAVRFAQVPTNATKVDAPVSYPFLWDTPQHDLVQWNGFAKNTVNHLSRPLFGTSHIGALGRNVGEVLGVFADVNTTNTVGLFRGYSSSVNVPNLIALEESLRALWSPEWPPTFGEIDLGLRDKGKRLYQENCIACHALLKRDDPDRRVAANMRVVGTDQTMARNVAERTANSGILRRRRLLNWPFHRLRPDDSIANLFTHVGQRVVVGPQLQSDAVTNTFENVVNAEIDFEKIRLAGSFSDLEFRDGKLISAGGQRVSVLQLSGEPLLGITGDSFMGPFNLAVAVPKPIEISQLANFIARAIDSDKIRYQYKARPLNGIWATAPYLHNGSVPNLNELLKPAARRLTKFRVGSCEFDVENVGFRIDHGDFEFDTTAAPGNSNAGHEYKKVFTNEERRQLIEFLKSL